MLRVKDGYLEQKRENTWWKLRRSVTEDREFDLVVSKSGCVMDKYNRIRHTIDCSCDDEVDEVRQDV